MQAHAFVLHLTRARKRRDNAHALKENCGLPGELWAAVDGTALDAADLAAETGARLFEPAYPFPLKPGEIGCFLSHRLCDRLLNFTSRKQLVHHDRGTT